MLACALLVDRGWAAGVEVKIGGDRVKSSRSNLKRVLQFLLLFLFLTRWHTLSPPKNRCMLEEL